MRRRKSHPPCFVVWSLILSDGVHALPGWQAGPDEAKPGGRGQDLEVIPDRSTGGA